MQGFVPVKRFLETLLRRWRNFFIKRRWAGVQDNEKVPPEDRLESQYTHCGIFYMRAWAYSFACSSSGSAFY